MTTSHLKEKELYDLLKDVEDMIEDNPSFTGPNTIYFGGDLIENQLNMYVGSCILKQLFDNLNFSTSWIDEMNTYSSNVLHRQIVTQYLTSLMTSEDPEADIQEEISYGFYEDDGYLIIDILEETHFLLGHFSADLRDETPAENGNLISSECKYYFSEDDLELIKLYGEEQIASDAIDYFSPDNSSFLDLLIIDKQKLQSFYNSINHLPRKWQKIAKRAFEFFSINLKDKSENISWIFSDNYYDYPCDDTYTTMSMKPLIGFIIIAAIIDFFNLNKEASA